MDYMYNKFWLSVIFIVLMKALFILITTAQFPHSHNSNNNSIHRVGLGQMFELHTGILDWEQDTRLGFVISMNSIHFAVGLILTCDHSLEPLLSKKLMWKV